MVNNAATIVNAPTLPMYIKNESRILLASLSSEVMPILSPHVQYYLSRDLRVLDSKLQQANWTTDLK